MSKNTKSKYGELIIDIASKPSFRIDDMRQKHRVSTRVFTVMRSMQIIKKRGKEHVWVGEQPTLATINLITKQCRYSSRVEKVMAKQLPPSQLTIKAIKNPQHQARAQAIIDEAKRIAAERPQPVPVHHDEPFYDNSNSKVMLILAVGAVLGFMIATLIWK